MDAVLECCIILVHPVDRIIGPHCLSNAQINFRTLGIDENLIYITLPAHVAVAVLESTYEGQLFPQTQGARLIR